MKRKSSRRLREVVPHRICNRKKQLLYRKEPNLCVTRPQDDVNGLGLSIRTVQAQESPRAVSAEMQARKRVHFTGWSSISFRDGLRQVWSPMGSSRKCFGRSNSYSRGPSGLTKRGLRSCGHPFFLEFYLLLQTHKLFSILPFLFLFFPPKFFFNK